MFSLYCQYRSVDRQQYIDHNLCFYDDSIPDQNYIVFSPTLEKEVGTSGSLSFVLPPTNIGYGSVSRDACELVCYKNGDEIWRGRILTDDSDFYNQRSIKCEGQLSYFNDVIIPRGNYGTENNPLNYSVLLSNYILALYNIKNGNNDITSDNFNGPYDKRIFLSSFPDAKYPGKYIKIDNDNVLDIINSICEDTKLYPVVTRDNVGTSENPKWRNRLHFIEGEKQSNGQYFPDTIEDQEVVFAENLLDFTRNYDVTTLVTAVTMKGSNIEGSETDDYYTLEALDRTGSGTSQDPYIYSDRTDPETGIMHVAQQTYMYYPSAIISYGWRETLLEIETTGTETEAIITDRPSEQLWTVGLNYLRVSQFDSMVIEINAVDLTYLGVSSESLDIYKNVKVISPPHGLDRYFPITSISIPLNDPGNTTYKMGIEEDVSLSSSYNKTNQDLLNKINALPSTKSILDIAKSNAASAIAGATTGHVTIVQNEQQGMADAIVISTLRDYKNTSPNNKVWVWNINGLSYWSGGWNGTSTPSDVNIAITNDGHIVANMITTGVMSAERIRGGHLIVSTETRNEGNVWCSFDPNEITFHRRHNNSDNTVGYIVPQVNDNLGNIWMVYNSDAHCFECDIMFVGNAEAAAGTVNDHHSAKTLGCIGDADTDSDGVYTLVIGNKNIYIKRGMVISEETIESGGTPQEGYNGSITIDGTTYDVVNGIIIEPNQQNNN